LLQISRIHAAIRANRVRIADHADEEAQNDRLAIDEIFHSVENGEIIEDYSEDRPYPSCLIYGNGPDETPIHSVWAYNEESGWVVLVTVYRPDPAQWTDWKVRKL
jgi:hypothetical protein